MPYKILVIDDHVMVAEAVAAILSEHEVTIARNKVEALKTLTTASFDFVLVDIHLDQHENGLSLIKPILACKAKPIVFDGGLNVGQIRASIRLGAYGYVNKELPLTHLHQVLNDVIDDRFSFPKGMLDELRQNVSLVIPQLAKSEKRLLNYFLMHREQTNFEIGDNMALSEGRIRNCMTSLMRKFDVKGRANLALEAEKRGYFPEDDKPIAVK